jgi:hypothetical protein
LDAKKQELAAATSQHETISISYQPTDDPVDAYAMSDGGALVLVGLQETIDVVAGAAPIKVTADGKGVVAPAPGNYHDLTTVQLVLAAFTVPPKTSALKVTGIGLYLGPISTIGTKV